MLKILTSVFLLLTTSMAQAQVISGYGIKLGLAVSNIVDDKKPVILSDLNSRLGPQMGLFVNFPDFRYLAIHAEVTYLKKGAEDKLLLITPENPEGTGEFITVDLFEFDYLAVSFSARPQLKMGIVQLYGMVGPSLDVLIADRNIAGGFTDVKRFTSSLVIGAGVQLLKPFDYPLLFEARYNPDLNHFFENRYYKLKHQVIQVVLGIKLK